jgi:hypothetical protein
LDTAADSQTRRRIVADINVERKGPSIWPWIIGLIVLALIIWALTQMFRTDPAVAPVTPVDTPAVHVDTPTTTVAPGVPQTTGPGVTTDTPIGGVGTPP